MELIIMARYRNSVFGKLIIIVFYCIVFHCNMFSYAEPEQHHNITELHEQERCKHWLSDEHVRHALQSRRQNAPPCPCTRQQTDLDYSFFKEMGGNCYVHHLFTDGVKQLCCYDKHEQLLIGHPGGGFLVLEDLTNEITEAYQSCCHGNKSLCKLFYNVNPSDDCSGYTVPQYAFSGGDVHITTVDGIEYDFNGHGEYVFLDISSEFLQIQIRTDYLDSDKHDATVITGIAIKAQKQDDNEIMILLNRTTKGATLYWNNTMYSLDKISFLSSPDGQVNLLPPRNNFVHMYFNDQLLDIGVEFGVADRLNIKLAFGRKVQIKPKTSGLAGASINGTMKSGIGIAYPVKSSEHDFFDFGESWALKDETESIFHYSLTNGNYSLYNDHHSKPRFLEDLVGNLTALFSTSSTEEVARFNSTCMGNKQCLLTIARTGNINEGKLIMETYRKEQYAQEIIDNSRPYFFANQSYLLNVSNQMTRPVVLDLREVVDDEQDSIDELRFDVLTNISSTDYILQSGIFNWTYVSPVLRYQPVVIKLYVYDHLNATNSIDVTIIYCGCEKHAQCSYKDFVQTKKVLFQRVGCQCNDELLEGRYCEKHKPPCNITTCYENVTCYDNAVDPHHPCGPCPYGYTGDGESCNDIDECNLNYCDQSCKNFEGSYRCDCNKGFDLSEDKRTCIDINECDSSTDKCKSGENKRCRNLPGDYECICKSNYYKIDGSCKKGGFAYIGRLVLQTSEKIPTDYKNITKTLTILFNNTHNFVSVEVIRITVDSRKKRSTKPLNIDFKVITSLPANSTVLKFSLQESMSEALSDPKNPNLEIMGQRPTGKLKMFEDEANLLCELPQYQVCDIVTTHCQTLNGSTHCECNNGFYEAYQDATFCKDIDECQNKTYLGKNSTNDRCYQGECQNTHGSWECLCPENKVLKDIGNYYYSCLGNYQYIGNISIHWLQPYNETHIQTLVHEKVNALFSTSTFTVANNTEMRQVFNDSEIITPPSFSSLGWGSYNVSLKFILHIGIPMSWDAVAGIVNQSLLTTNGNSTIQFGNAYIYDENNYSICDVPGLTNCDSTTTGCSVTNGSFHCSCKDGYMKTQKMKQLDTKYCTDINECEEHTPCLNGTCQNTVGSWFCACDKYSNFTRLNSSHGQCDDIDECESIGKESCGEYGTCVNERPGWKCNCSQGYTSVQIGPNTHECKDINECEEHTPCLNGTCQNTVGSWFCACDKYSNFTRLNSSHGQCDDIDECESIGKESCGEYGTCVNESPGWKCNCSQGYTSVQIGPNTHECKDIDECDVQNCSSDGNCCGQHGECKNTIGYWTCSCSPGYEVTFNSYNNISCNDINECEHNNTYICIGGLCNNSIGSWNCVCDKGYDKKEVAENVYICEDKDECSSEDYRCDGIRCINMPGSWSCVCEQGYKNTSVVTENHVSTVQCNNINECNEDEYLYSACLESVGCVDSYGSWECLCRPGLSPRAINTTTKICGGKFQYIRMIQFSLVTANPDTTILQQAIQERLLQMYQEKIQTQSVTVYIEIISLEPVTGERFKRQGSPQKISGDWLVKYAIHTNVAVNSSTINSVIEDYQSKCNTTACPQESIGPKKYAIHFAKIHFDINATEGLCEIPMKDICNHTSSVCNDKNDTVECNCKTGYQLDPNSITSCKDINECETPSLNNCTGNVYSQDKSCINLQGTWTCACQDGYFPNRTDSSTVSCDDIDECTDPEKYGCKGDGVFNCTNLPGNWTCFCAHGYSQTIFNDRVICTDIDECNDVAGEFSCKDSSVDGTGADCTNTLGDWSCSCDIGYRRRTIQEDKKYECDDICDDGLCRNGGTCLHELNEQNFTCVCSSGWEGQLCNLPTIDAEASHLKTVLIAVGASAGGIILLLAVAIFGVCRYRFANREDGERLSLKTFGEHGSWPLKNGEHGSWPLKNGEHSSWPLKNGNVYTSPHDSISLPSNRRLSIPRPRHLKNPSQDLYLDEAIMLRNPAPDYDMRDQPGVTNPAPDYGLDDSPAMLRRYPDTNRRGSYGNFTKNKYTQEATRDNRRSLPVAYASSYL